MSFTLSYTSKTVAFTSQRVYSDQYQHEKPTIEEEYNMSAKVNKDTCVGCESCISACPVEAIAMTDGKAGVDASTCVECGACVSACPVEAISL